MRVMIDINVDQFSTDDLIAYARTVGCPVRGTMQDAIKWLIRQYGFSLLHKMSDFVRERDADK